VVPVQDLPASEHALWVQSDALLLDLGCDDDTRLAAAWYAVARAYPEAWRDAAQQVPPAVRRLVEGQQQAGR
jgi:hypothetical protein